MNFIINTENSNISEQSKSNEEWLQEQIEWNRTNISGSGILEIIKTLKGELIGCEIGVCLGVTTELYAKELNNLKKIYAVDHYPEFVDWNGFDLNKERQELIKQYAYNKLKQYPNVEIVYKNSSDFVERLEDNELDFIFIDGDHRYKSVLRDITMFYPKVKTGGIFAGHDINLPDVQKALIYFFGNNRTSDIKIVENNAWYLIK